MTRRVLGAELRLIRPRERITADWLNDVAATAERKAKQPNEETTQEPEGEDGDGAAVASNYTEDNTRRVETTIRIEDQSDPSVYVEYERIDEIVFINDADASDEMKLVLVYPP